MTREWQAGDVATLVISKSGVEAIAVRNAANDGWEHANTFGGGSAFDSIGGFSVKSRLAVIDPEDREQVERLAAAWEDITHAPLDNEQPMTLRQLRMRAALHSLIARPKPDEPNNYLAAVVDENGTRWARVRPTAKRKWINEFGDYADWSMIPAVEVLSEGVTA